MYYSASVMDVVKSIVTGEFFLIPVVTAAIFALLKIVPNDKIQATVGKAARGLGILITVGLTKWKWSKPFWNRVIEPWFIDIVDNTIVTFAKEFIVGLRSDNED